MTTWTRAIEPEEEDRRRDALGDLLTEYRDSDDPAIVALRQGARQVVPGAGSLSPLVLLVGEAPGANEDRAGQPFVGAAGNLLREALEAVGLDPEADCFITNVVKFRPPENRTPRSAEVAASLDLLEREIALLDPLLVVPLGAVALRALWPGGPTITNGRGQPQAQQHASHPVQAVLLPTWHPSAVLRDDTGEKRRQLWGDLALAAELVAPGRDS